MKSGWRSYESAWRIHVAPRWGSVQLADVKFSDVAAWIAELSAKRGPVIVETAASVLRRILDDAVRDRMLACNPERGVKLPKRAPRRNVYLTRDQLDALATEAGRYRSLVLLLGAVGLRWGEAAALRVSDVDFLRRRIHLHRNAVTVGKQTHVGTLKSGKSRTVALPRFVTDALAVTAEGKGPRRSACGPRRRAAIWPRQRPASRGCPGRWRAVRGPIRRFRGSPRTRCDTAASLAISAGAKVKVVQRMLGHSSAAMTLDVYADLFDTDLDAVAERLDSGWHGVSREGEKTP